VCGISGIWHFNEKQFCISEIEILKQSLWHRGPDGNGHWVNEDKNLVLIHNRLAILDLSLAASQPMLSDNGNYVIVLNGEIFNFIEIREELKQKGHVFKTETDTEVILHAYLEWGKEMYTRLNGMWAFALFDKMNNKLILSRDRFGVKPLYYSYQNERIVFASEIQAIHKYLGKDARLNKEVIGDIAKGSFDYHGTCQTYLSYVNALPGGYNLVVDKNGIIKERWYEFKKVHVPDSFKKQAEELKEILTDACRIRLRSDVPIGTCLSGGVDSGSITAVVKNFNKNTEERIDKYTHRSFCASMPGTSIDESNDAQMLATILGSKLDIINVLPPTPVELEQAMEQCDGPMHTLAFYPIWSLYRYIKNQGITVTLDGQGPDEMLGGYTPLYEALQAAFELKKPFWFLDVFKTYAAQGENIYKSSRADASYILKLFFIKKWKSFTIIFRKNQNKVFTEFNFFAQNNNNYTNALDKSLYKQFFQSPLPAILNQYDRCSMANGVECRMPFMDYRVVEFIFSLPVTSKVGKGYTKRVLREAMKDILPDKFRLNKVKIGFNAPIIEWFRGPLKEWMQMQMEKDTFLNSTYFDGHALKKQFEIFVKKEKTDWSEAWKFWAPVHISWWLEKNKLNL